MPKDPYEVFAERLRAIPYGQNGRIAAEIGIDQGTLARWKRKDLTVNPTLKNIEGVARALGRPIAWLFTEGEAPPPAAAAPSPEAVTPPEPEEYIRFRLHCPHCKSVIEETKVDGKADGQRRRRK
jgi:transcriptional regulator with XRE-family HTH domain